MNIKLHLLGGSGRIGLGLVDTLVTQPSPYVKEVHIYCDSTKVKEIQAYYSTATTTHVTVSGYSDLNSLSSASISDSKVTDACKHIVLNLRGINNKQQWLNQPLDSLELHTKSCRALVDANLWMHPDTEIIHFSSMLCDLIEGASSLDDICEGQESYRRPYVVSRLHQEMILAANAYQHSISTTFLRMPAAYGFNDDRHSPWVLNSLCKAKLRGLKVYPRHPERIVYLSHRDLLLAWIRTLIEESPNLDKQRIVNFLRPPLLRMSVLSLATLVQESPRNLSSKEAQKLQITLEGDGENSEEQFAFHLKLLNTSILELLSND